MFTVPIFCFNNALKQIDINISVACINKALFIFFLTLVFLNLKDCGLADVVLFSLQVGFRYYALHISLSGASSYLGIHALLMEEAHICWGCFRALKAPCEKRHTDVFIWPKHFTRMLTLVG